MSTARVAVLQAAARALGAALHTPFFGEPVSFVYNPLDYAWEAHAQYLERFGRSRKRVVLVGMNPGPFGMAQTGVPFGEVAAVSTWMGIVAPVGKPAREHPSRPVLGFHCKRSEVSGARLWGAIAARYPNADDFFRDHFVVNYCPLLFLDEGGRNLTPDKLRPSERAPMLALCDAHLRAVLAVLAPAVVLGVGTWAAARVQANVVDAGVQTGALPHPSPASPAANRGWAEAARAALVAQRVEPFLEPALAS